MFRRARGIGLPSGCQPLASFFPALSFPWARWVFGGWMSYSWRDIPRLLAHPAHMEKDPLCLACRDDYVDPQLFGRLRERMLSTYPHLDPEELRPALKLYLRGTCACASSVGPPTELSTSEQRVAVRC